MCLYPHQVILVGMSTRRHRRPYSGSRSIQSKIPSRYENTTQERIDRNRRGADLCRALITSHQEHKKASKEP